MHQNVEMDMEGAKRELTLKFAIGTIDPEAYKLALSVLGSSLTVEALRCNQNLTKD